MSVNPQSWISALALTTALLGAAQAQLAAPANLIAVNPALKNFLAKGDVYTDSQGNILRIVRKGEFAKTATIVLPKSDYAVAGTLFGVVSGYGEAIAKPVTEWLKANADKLSAGVKVNAEDYVLSVRKVGDKTNMDISLNSVPLNSFASVKNIYGDPKAPLAVRVYSDFQCPYCQKLEQDFLINFRRNLPKDVRLEFHHFPLTQIHPNAIPSAEASECAADQNKFWEYHDALFSDRSWVNQPNATDSFVQLAKAVGLDTAVFKTCYTNHKNISKVKAGIKESQRLQVSGTPTVFVGPYRLANPYDAASYERFFKFLR